MEIDDLLSDRVAIEIPNPKGGAGLVASCNPEAVTMKIQRQIMALDGKSDDLDASYLMLKALDVDWNLTKNGKTVLIVPTLPANAKAAIDAATPEGQDPDYPPTLEDVSAKALAMILQALTEAARPKEPSGTAI